MPSYIDYMIKRVLWALIMLVSSCTDERVPKCQDVLPEEVTKEDVKCDEKGLCEWEGVVCTANPNGDLR